MIDDNIPFNCFNQQNLLYVFRYAFDNLSLIILEYSVTFGTP